MGAYYVWIETVVQYIDSNGYPQCIIQGEEPIKKYTIQPSDSDFETPYTLNDEIEEYDRRILYEYGMWRCLPKGKLRIQKLCYKHKISIDSVVSVFKFKNGYYK